MQINKPENTLENFSVGSKEVNAARLAFFIPGFAVSTWAPMIPIVKERLNLEAFMYRYQCFYCHAFCWYTGTKMGLQKSASYHHDATCT